MGNVHMEATQINYREGGTKMSVAQAIKNAGSEITPEEKTWIDSIPALTTSNAGKTDQDVIAPEFDAESGVYAVGDKVMYDGKLYKFTTSHETPGDWDSTEVSETTVDNELSSLESGLTNYEATTNAALALPTNTGKNVFPVTLALLKGCNTDGTWNGNDYTISGVTFACAFNSDGYLTSITANGTSTGYIYFRFYQRTINPLHLDGSFIVSGGLNDNAIFVVGRTYNGAWKVLGASNGRDSKPFTVALSDDIGANIEADNGTEFTNAMFYPMIRSASITDPTFAPYIPSVESRIEAVESGLTGHITTYDNVTIAAGSTTLVANLAQNKVCCVYAKTSTVMAYVAEAIESDSLQIYARNFGNDSITTTIYLKEIG